MKLLFSLSIILLLFYVPIQAEVIIDGTLGSSVKLLTGPYYKIKAELGQQQGGNLFHSFRDFNLNSHESATFSGPSSINNVISRVTGGNPSNIDGLLRSTIPNANMYFLNPYGIMFGANARLDVQGSFHASTADYLRLGNGGRFDARQPNNSLLTVAPVEAFGFLGNTVAPISVEGRGKITETDWEGNPTGLTVLDGKTLSLIGGNLDIKKGTFLKTVRVFDDGSERTNLTRLGSLSAPHGRINLASVASKGEVVPTALGLDLSSFVKLGNISVTDKSSVNVSGTGGGQIFIRGGRFFASDSGIYAKTLGNKQGGVIDIRASTVSLIGGSQLSGDTRGLGRGSDIRIQATDSITVSGEDAQGKSTIVYSQSGSRELIDADLGHAGQIRFEAQTILFKEGASMSVTTYGRGQGGDITLKASESVTFSGESRLGGNSQILLLTFGTEEEAADAGTLTIEANKISFKDGAGIFSQTAGKGKGGTMTLRAKEFMSLSGVNTYGSGSILESSVSTKSNGGDAGKIILETKDLLLYDGASVIASTFGPGKGGNVSVFATGTVTVSGASNGGWNSSIASSSNPKTPVIGGTGGDIRLEARKLVLKNGGSISSSSIAPEGFKSSQAGNITIKAGSVEIIGVNPYGETEDGFGSGIYARSKGTRDSAGNAGEIFLETDSLSLQQGGVISSSTTGHARGGSIEIRVNGKMRIAGDSSKLALKEPAYAQLSYQKDFEDYTLRDSISGIYASSSSPTAGAGEAGEIRIQANTISLTEGSTINTSTQNAGGGNITVTIPNVLYLREGKITTSVKGGKGRGGDITIFRPLVVALDQGLTKAQADEGQGGNIYIESEQFIKSPDSLISASSRLGIDGKVEIDSPITNMDEFMTVLPGHFLDASRQLPMPCHLQRATHRNSFVVKQIAGSPPSPGDWQSNRLVLLPPEVDDNRANSSSRLKGKTARHSAPKVALLLTSCRPNFSQAQAMLVVKSSVIEEQLF
jgi:filamentous hemagglutinin family protein